MMMIGLNPGPRARTHEVVTHEVVTHEVVTHEVVNNNNNRRLVTLADT